MKPRHLIGLLSALTVPFSSCNKDQGETKAGPPGGGGPLPLQVAHPIKEKVALQRIFTGRFVPIERVELRARVSGYLEEVGYQEGKMIEKGDLMVRIDPQIFNANVALAEARLAQTETAARLAEQNSQRADDLIEKRAISREEADVRRSELSRAKADVQAAEAQLQIAQLNRSYADISAPISGIVGEALITEGNYVTGGGPTAPVLTTIIPQSPIYCEFDVDERQVLQFTRLYFQGKSDGRGGEQPEVEIAVSDSDDFAFKGKLTFGDNELDRQTATLKLRATVANEDQFLTPGLFGRVRVTVGEPTEEILVKEKALGFDQSKRFAWVLQPDNGLKKTYVEIGELHGQLRVVKSGLTVDDQIAISKIQLIRPGIKVAPQTGEMKTEG